MASDAPLPIPTTGPTHADVLDTLRSFILEGINGVIDKALEQLLLPDDQAALCLDAAQFTTFLMAVKIAEVRALPPTAENLFKWYWPMAKALKDEVPGMIRAHAAAAAAARVQS